MLKFQAVAEKTAKNFTGLLFLAAPCRLVSNWCRVSHTSWKEWKST